MGTLLSAGDLAIVQYDGSTTRLVHIFCARMNTYSGTVILVTSSF